MGYGNTGSESEDDKAGDEEMDTGMEVAEAQWKAYVKKLREGGELSSAMAICDVSGSMHGQPMQVCLFFCQPLYTCAALCVAAYIMHDAGEYLNNRLRPPLWYFAAHQGLTAPKGPPRDWPTHFRARGDISGQPQNIYRFGKLASGQRPEATWL